MTSELEQKTRPEQMSTSTLDQQRDIRARAVHPSHKAAPFTRADVVQSIVQRFEQQVVANPCQVAIKTPAGRWTYRALNEPANHLARMILDRLGADPEPVALLLGSHSSTIVALLAVLKAAKFYVTLDPGYPPDRLRLMMRDSGARLVVTDGANKELAAALVRELDAAGAGDPILDWDSVGAPEPALAANLDLAIAADTLAYIIYTSGSTGEPRGIVYDHRLVLAGIRNYTYHPIRFSTTWQLVASGCHRWAGWVTPCYLAPLKTWGR